MHVHALNPSLLSRVPESDRRVTEGARLGEATVANLSDQTAREPSVVRCCFAIPRPRSTQSRAAGGASEYDKITIITTEGRWTGRSCQLLRRRDSYSEDLEWVFVFQWVPTPSKFPLSALLIYESSSSSPVTETRVRISMRSVHQNRNRHRGQSRHVMRVPKTECEIMFGKRFNRDCAFIFSRSSSVSCSSRNSSPRRRGPPDCFFRGVPEQVTSSSHFFLLEIHTGCALVGGIKVTPKGKWAGDESATRRADDNMKTPAIAILTRTWNVRAYPELFILTTFHRGAYGRPLGEVLKSPVSGETRLVTPSDGATDLTHSWSLRPRYPGGPD
ncbi:hypothetical protein C7M84_004400 [Penaeus vannamei]|uniref:Uncharacterized protein n=1 Tax=Penaeus vannamei TaxID=6689 RepID=A0A423TKJ5_PENVA|nr:hypothetical protein C7M84_004400 [Penaeus vannamei]